MYGFIQSTFRLRIILCRFYLGEAFRFHKFAETSSAISLSTKYHCFAPNLLFILQESPKQMVKMILCASLALGHDYEVKDSLDPPAI
jgi:hypothetical protein